MSQEIELKKKFIFVIISILILLFPVTWKYYSPDKYEVIIWLGLSIVWLVFIWSYEIKSKRIATR